jgi:hypothetical protein
LPVSLEASWVPELLSSSMMLSVRVPVVPVSMSKIACEPATVTSIR